VFSPSGPKVKSRKGEENEQTDDTGGNQTRPAKLRQVCSNLGRGRLGCGRVRPMATAAEYSRRSRARRHDDEIVPWISTMRAAIQSTILDIPTRPMRVMLATATAAAASLLGINRRMAIINCLQSQSCIIEVTTDSQKNFMHNLRSLRLAVGDISRHTVAPVPIDSASAQFRLMLLQ
jgi:hypothetical protein